MFGQGTTTTKIKALILAEDKASPVIKKFAVGIGVVTAGVAAFGVASVKAFTESQDLIAQTNAVLKSTGSVAGVTAQKVTELASAFQRTTRFSDEEIRSAQNLLLTFTKIGQDIFPQATETVLDMATALGTDARSASIQLGKALQDPILGVTALRRVGVNFNKEQTEVIKKLVETGQSAKAQQLILKELRTEFGGSAKAAGETFAGSLVRLKNQLNDVQETVGGVIVRALVPFAERALAAVQAVDWEAVVSRSTSAVRDLAQRGLLVAQQAFIYLRPSIEAILNTLRNDLVPVLTRLWKEILQPLVPVIGTALVVALGLAIDALNLLVAAFSGLANWLLDNKDLLLPLIAAFGTLWAVMMARSAFIAFTTMMTTIQTVTIPGAIASLGALKAALIGFTGWGIFAAAGVAAFVAISNKARETMNVLDDTAKKVESSTDSQIVALKRLGELKRSGTPEQQRRASEALRNIRGFQSGVENFRGGLAFVHKDEALVNMPPGTDVIPKHKVPGMGGGSISLNVNVGLYAGTEQEKRRIAAELLRSLKDLASAQGLSVGQMLGVK